MSNKSVTFQPFCCSASNNNPPGEGDISLFRQMSTHPPPSKEENFKNLFASAVWKLGVFSTVVDLFDRVMRPRRKIYRNGLQKDDLKASHCGFRCVKCKCVCFFAWNLELILSSSEGLSSDSEQPHSPRRFGCCPFFWHLCCTLETIFHILQTSSKFGQR